jgi:hypothetical protein
VNLGQFQQPACLVVYKINHVRQLLLER